MMIHRQPNSSGNILHAKIEDPASIVTILDPHKDGLPEPPLVTFKDIYISSTSLTCRLTIPMGLKAGYGDRIALYRLPYLQPQQFITYCWIPDPEVFNLEQEISIALPEKLIDDESYQLHYLKSNNTVAGASFPFQLGGCREITTGPESLNVTLPALEVGDIQMTRESPVIARPSATTQRNNSLVERVSLLEMMNKKHLEKLALLEAQNIDLKIQVTELLEKQSENVIGKKTHRQPSVEQAAETIQQPEAPLEPDSKDEKQKSKGLLSVNPIMRVGLRSFHGKYMTAIWWFGLGGVEVKVDHLNAWEEIDIYRFINGKVGLKSCHGKWLSAQPDGSLQWNRDKCLGWEMFEMEEDDEGKVAFRSHEGRFISAQPDGKLMCKSSLKNVSNMFEVTYVK